MGINGLIWTIEILLRKKAKGFDPSEAPPSGQENPQVMLVTF
jgi:hypothetical protein